MRRVLFFVVMPFLVFLLGGCKNDSSPRRELIDKSKESCLACHSDMTGFSQAHNPIVIGCSSCHLGNVFENDKDLAHKGMIKIPGNISNSHLSCSTSNCHQSELGRVKKSLMTTNSGIVSIDKYIFDEIHTSDTLFHISDIGGTASERHIRNQCFKCHLDRDKKNYGHVTELTRGGGCLACHIDYHNGTEINIADSIHPTLSLNVGNDKCFGCHSRSGRISLGYEGWYETLLTKNNAKNDEKHRILLDGRVLKKSLEDVHHTAGMQCIDCHSSQEIMGDGKVYKHSGEAVKIHCDDCHISGDKYNKVGKSNFGEITALDYALRNYKLKSDSFLITKTDAIALHNSYFDSTGNAFLIGKINQNKYKLNPRPDICTKDLAHENLSCSMCHTAWAPKCIGCHTAFDKNVTFANSKNKGKWYELVDDFGIMQPAMARDSSKGHRNIVPAIPGMIFSLDKTDFDGEKYGEDITFHRLYGPIEAHTTNSNPRDCQSCHLSAEALGYGAGTITVKKENGEYVLKFYSEYELSEEDSLPMDAWIGFLQERDNDKRYSAHSDFYPLDLNTQKRVILVGTCLECHKNQSDFQKEMLTGNFEKLLKTKTRNCKIPKELWNR